MKAKVTERGLLIPRRFLKGIEEVEIRKENGLIVVMPVVGNDPVFNIGKHPIEDDITDASINHDYYIYNLGRAEMSTDDFRVTQTEERILNQGVTGQVVPNNFHNEVGRNVRAYIEDSGGTMPEDLPLEPSIKPLLQPRKRVRKKQALRESAEQPQLRRENDKD